MKDRRTIPWNLRCFMMGTAIALMPACGKGPTPSAPDKAVLGSLASFKPEYELDNHGWVIGMKLENRRLTPEAFTEIGKLIELRRLSLWGSSVSDENVARLKSLNKLRSLGLGATLVTDQGLRHLKDFKNLQRLWLPKTDNITDGEVSKLKKSLPGLKVEFQKGP